MDNKKFISIVLITIFAASITVAAGETTNFDKASKNSANISIGEYRNLSFLDQITSNLLSVTSSSDTYEPGETASFDVTAEFKFEDTGSFVKVVEFYRCADSGCDDPNQDQFLEAARDSEFFYAQIGDVVSWNVDYSTPSTESYYAASAYVYNSDTDSVLTETPNRKIFEVEEDTTTDSDNDGVIDSNDDCPFEYGEGSNGCPVEEVDLALSQTPSFTVNEETNRVTGTLQIKNSGAGDMQQSDIVEMQVRPYGSNPLSFASDTVDTCDSDYPNNVHKDYSLTGEDSLKISLTNQESLTDGKTYTVYFMTRDSCGGSKVEPIYNSYNSGTFTLDDPDSGDSGSGSDTTKEPSVIQVSKPSVEYSDGVVSSDVSFKNEGGDMQSDRIVEMQVRPKGSNPLSFGSTTSVCDSSYPENVHKSFNLDAGESDSTTLSTSAVEPGSGEYTVYLLTRSGCGGEKVEPYYNSVRAGSIDTGQGTVSLPSGSLPLIIIVAGVILVVGGALYRWV